jgi:hypothetical protein
MPWCAMLRARLAPITARPVTPKRGASAIPPGYPARL